MVNTSDSELRSRGFEPHSGSHVVSLSKTYLPPPPSTGNTLEAVIYNLTDFLFYTGVNGVVSYRNRFSEHNIDIGGNLK